MNRNIFTIAAAVAAIAGVLIIVAGVAGVVGGNALFFACLALALSAIYLLLLTKKS
jgi:hypothetical protein